MEDINDLYGNDSYMSMYDTTGLPDAESRVGSIIIGSILFLLSAIAIIGNIATTLAFRENRKLRHKTSNLLILSLSCCDLAIGATGLPFAAITATLGGWPLGKPVCIIGAFFSVLGVSGGMYTLVAINVDRWLLVSREYSAYLRIQSLRNIKLQILGAWILAFLLASCETIIWAAGGARDTENLIDFTMECRSPVRTDPRFAFITFVLLFAGPFFVMIICSLRFVVLLRRRLHKPKPKISSSNQTSPVAAEQKAGEPVTNASQKEFPQASQEESEPMTPASEPKTPVSWDTTISDTGNGRQNSQASRQSSGGKKRSFFVFGEAVRKKIDSKKMKNRYIKPAVRLAILMSVFAFCSLPYPFFVLIADTKCQDCAVVIARNHLSNLLLTNSALNPFLYAIMHRQIRRYHARKFKSIFCRHKRGA